jgi:hypothetical protein
MRPDQTAASPEWMNQFESSQDRKYLMNSSYAPALHSANALINPAGFRGVPERPAGDAGAPSESLRFRQLYTPREFSRVLHLREEIHLPAETLADPAFIAREKKETRSVS